MNELSSQDVKNHYDVTVPRATGNRYEHDRWFKNEEARAGYAMTREVILSVLTRETFHECFELGPGAGTWTALIAEQKPDAHITVLDISRHMLDMAKAKLGVYGDRVQYTEADFTTYVPEKQYDFFFSSRALEYFPDKKHAVEKIYDILAPGGSGLIITKYPKYWTSRIKGHEVPEMHRHQIAPAELKTLLKAAGFDVLEMRSAVVTFPFFRSAFLHRCLHALIGRLPLFFVHTLFSESYTVYVKKP